MPTRLKVCHRVDGGEFTPITIPLGSLPDHRAHGDIVPGMDGHDCTCPEREAPLMSVVE